MKVIHKKILKHWSFLRFALNPIIFGPGLTGDLIQPGVKTSVKYVLNVKDNNTYPTLIVYKKF